MAHGAPRFPDAALEWLCGEQHGHRVLALTPAAGLPRKLAAHGDQVWCIDKRSESLEPLVDVPGITVSAARAEAMPFTACQFDMVLAHQVMHRLAPGIVFGEIARVLKPGGWLAISCLTRDDSVPWVRRLITLMRTVDPTAMSSDMAAEVAAQLGSSKYFPHQEQRDFRIWVPVDRDSLLAMTALQPCVTRLGRRDHDRLLAAVGAIYDGASAGSELRLPYQLSCWRVYVDHSEMTTPIMLGDDALIIGL